MVSIPTLNPEQQQAVDYLRRRRQGLVKSPAGSGKTIMAAAALHAVLTAKARAAKVRVGWVANTTEQCRQAAEAVAMFPIVGNGPGDGLATVTIRCAAAGTDWSDRDVLVADECHHAHAPGWFDQISACAGARWGFSATPEFEGDLADWKRQRLEELFGDDWLELEGRTGRLVRAKVVLCDPPWPEGLAERIESETERLFRARRRFWGGDPQQLRAQVWWQKCVELGICGNPARTEQVVALARLHHRLGDSVLVLVPLVDYAQRVAEAVGDGAMACYSGMGAKARRLALHCFKHGEVRCLVATSLADEGLDVPRANVLVLASGGRNKAKAEQRTGRVLRAFAGKERGLIYDFKDSAHKLMAKHARRRADLFRELGYEVVDSGGGVV